MPTSHPPMTRQHFQFIADTLRYCAAHCDSDEESRLVEWVTEKFADELPRTNRSFDRGRFLAAARVGR